MRSLPIPDILMLILDRGSMSKDEIQRMWAVTDEEYAALRTRLGAEKLIRPAPGRGGGFEGVFAQRPAAAVEGVSAPLTYASATEAEAARVLGQYLTHADVEELLGDLLYTIRRARFRQTQEDRRGTKEELVAAMLTQHGVDLLADKAVRDRVGRRVGLKPPGRWHAGKASALAFVQGLGLPAEYAGIPAEEPPADFEYLEGRVTLKPLQDFQREVQRKMRERLADRDARAIVTLPTGAGKTRTAVDTIRDWLSARHGERGSGAGCVVLWLAHTEELCEQAATCFREVWQGSHEVCPLLLFRFWGGYTRDLLQHRETLLSIRQRPAVLVSTPQRLVNLAEGKLTGGEAVLESLRELVGLVVIDEAHRAAAPMYRKLMGVFGGGPEGPGIIGLTATPFRHSTDAARPESGMLELRELFGTILEPVETLGEEPRQTLQRRGFLAQPVFTSLPTRTRLRPPEGVNTEDPSDEDTERIDFALKMRADQPDRRLIALEHMVGLCQSPKAITLHSLR